MRRFLFSAILGLFATACETSTHYDSISTTLDVDVAAAMQNAGEPAKVHQRYQFDRDLANVSSMSLESAWLASPFEKETEGQMGLRIVSDVQIFIVEADETRRSWIKSAKRKNVEEEELVDAQLGNLQPYLDAYQQLEIETEITIDPFFGARYWRDVCGLADTCLLSIPLSMQFRMDD